jgi:hypothetical protein
MMMLVAVHCCFDRQKSGAAFSVALTAASMVVVSQEARRVVCLRALVDAVSEDNGLWFGNAKYRHNDFHEFGHNDSLSGHG